MGYIQCFQNDVIIRNCYYDTDFTDNITMEVAGYASVGAECMSDSEGKADTYMLSGAFPVDLGTGWRYVAGAYPVYDANGTKTVAISQPEKDNVPLNRNIFRLEVGDLVNNTDIGADAVIPYSDFRLVDVIQDGTDITVDSFTVNGVSIADGAAVFVSDYPETTINFSASVTNHTAAELQAQVNYYRALFGRGRRMFSAESLANLNTPLVAAETALRDNYINITKTEADGYLDDMYAAALVRLLCNITFTAEHGKVMKGGEEVSSVIEEKNTAVTFTAVPDDGYEFVYWVDEHGNILGQDPVLVYSVFYNIGITAVFRDAGKIFTYQDSYGTVYKVQKVTDFSQVDYPFNVGEEGVRSGFKVKEWTNDYPGDLPSSGSVTSDVTFTAVLTRISSDAFTVRYKANPDAEWTTGEFKLGRVFEAEAAASYGGQAFSCWKDGNDNVVSFENRIKISVYSDMDLTACFDGAADSVTIASLQEPVAYSGEGKISFAGQVLEGDDFGSMVYYGVLMLKSSTDPGDLTFDTSNVIVGKAKSRSALTGTFIINKKNVNAGETWYGRAFAVYYDTDNEMKIVYSDTKHATL
ncbi:MAG: hypothetical protein ILO36_07480 [Abditibacteriota bacterium]|nr:hypothetical protein [Abditibacteriota bacterium]